MTVFRIIFKLIMFYLKCLNWMLLNTMYHYGSTVGRSTVLCRWCYVCTDPGWGWLPEGHSCGSGGSRALSRTKRPCPHEDWPGETSPWVGVFSCQDHNGRTHPSAANHRRLTRGECTLISHKSQMYNKGWVCRDTSQITDVSQRGEWTLISHKSQTSHKGWVCRDISQITDV